MQELIDVFSKTVLPFDIICHIYMLQISTIHYELKKELLQMYNKFYESNTRLLYIKKHQRLLMKYRIKQKLKYYKNY